jgi:uncharacterized membrane protein HdeD (DUF308 family)
MNTRAGDRGWGDPRPLVDADALARNWWAIALRGLAGIIFGVLAFVVPGVTLAVLVLLFGAYALVDGIFNVMAALSGRSGRQAWWMLLLEGVVSVAAGLVAFFMPGLTALALVYVISAWAFVTGVLEIVAAIRLRKVIRNEWWLALGGVVSIIFAVFLAVAPGAGALALVFWIGAYALVFGVFLVALGVRLRRRHREAGNEPIRRAA